MSTINGALATCLASIAVTFFVMVLAANIERLLSAGVEEDEE